jgi:large subunit ribosomal protein L22
MEVKAKTKFIRISPRKIRLVVDIVRGMEVNKAISQLIFIKKEAKTVVMKLINSAIANATNNFNLDKNNLFIKEIRVDEGATLKRWLPRAHGRATPLRKRTSHILLTLAEIKDSGDKKAKAIKLAPVVKLNNKVKAEKPKEIKREVISKKDEAITGAQEELGKTIVDPRMEGRHAHAKVEGGGHKGFVGKIFRRKSG